MAPWKTGQTTIEYLIGGHKLERLEAGNADVSALRLLERSALRIKTAESGLEGGDPEGAYVASYDAYRMAADSLLVRQELRATGGFGSHAVVEDAVSAQFGSEVPPFAKPTFERFRRTRNAAQYFDPDAPEIADDDARWAIGTSSDAVAEVRRLLESGSVGPYLSA